MPSSLKARDSSVVIVALLWGPARELNGRTTLCGVSIWSCCVILRIGGVGSELLGALGGGREAGAVVVESVAGARAVAGPDHRSLGVVVGEGSSAGEGEVGVLLHALLVCVPGSVGGSLSLEVRVDG